MNITTLKAIARESLKNIEADVIMVFYNQELGVCVYPIWEHSYEFNSSEEMKEGVELEMINNLIEFSDSAAAGMVLGAYAFEWDRTKE